MVSLESPIPVIDGSFEQFIEEFDRLMLSSPRAALEHVDSAPAEHRSADEWFICRAEALRACSGSENAARFLAGVMADAPEFADGQYLLAELYEEMGCGTQAIQHYLETLRLDQALDLVTEPASEELRARIAAEAGQVLAELTPKFRDKLATVPVFLLPRPTEELVEAGVDPRSLGLFEGPDLANSAAASLEDGPTSITLFVNCLLDAFGQDEAELLEEVRVTVLHEVGHYFCLDEEQLAELGLD